MGALLEVDVKYEERVCSTKRVTSVVGREGVKSKEKMCIIRKGVPFHDLSRVVFILCFT